MQARRHSLFLSQYDLARKVDIHENTLQAIESDPHYRSSFKTVRRLAEVFGCEPSELVRAEEAVS